MSWHLHAKARKANDGRKLCACSCLSPCSPTVMYDGVLLSFVRSIVWRRHHHHHQHHHLCHQHRCHHHHHVSQHDNIGFIFYILLSTSYRLLFQCATVIHTEKCHTQISLSKHICREPNSIYIYYMQCKHIHCTRCADREFQIS